MTYKDKFKAQMKKAGINSLDDLKTDAEKKAFFKAVDKSHDAVNEELLAIAEEAINEFKLKDSDIENVLSNPGDIISKGYDIVINGYEVAGGSIRIHDHKLQKDIFKIMNLSDKEISEKFGFFIDALK